MRTLQELAKEAYEIQNSTNLCGIAQGFAKAVLDLQPYEHSPKVVRGEGGLAFIGVTENRVRIAIINIWMDKMEDLADPVRDCSPGRAGEYLDNLALIRRIGGVA